MADSSRLRQPKWILALGVHSVSYDACVSVAHAEQRLQPLRSNDVPASLFGEERHCFGAWTRWWPTAAGKEG